MSLNYSFQVLTRTSVIDALMQAVTCHLVPESAKRLACGIPWGPEFDRDVLWAGDPPACDRGGFDGLSPGQYEGQNDYCMTFAFPTDAALAQYQADQPVSMISAKGTTAVGCVWISIDAGRDFALFQANAATSRMSQLFLNSLSIRTVWTEITRGSGASALFFDTNDSEHWELIYPDRRQVRKPDWELYELEQRHRVNMDAYGEAVLHLAGVA